MKSYKQLTREQRYPIYGLKQAGLKQTGIAQKVGVNKSTISREFRRNKGRRGWRPKQAQSLRDERKQVCVNGKFSRVRIAYHFPNNHPRQKRYAMRTLLGCSTLSSCVTPIPGPGASAQSLRPLILEKSFHPRKTQKARKFSKRYRTVDRHPKGE